MSVRELTVLTAHDSEIEAILGKYPNKRSATLPLLFLVQSVEGHVTEDGMRDVAQVLGLTPAEVLAVASFYTMLKKRPTGEYLVSVCRNITCTHRGGRKVLAAFEERLGITAGETTADGRFSLEAAECLATCDGAPSLQVNYEDFYSVTPDDAASLIDELTSGKPVNSVAGEPVKTHREISREIAMNGALFDITSESLPTAGGESGDAQVAQAHRPRVDGDDGRGA